MVTQFSKPLISVLVVGSGITVLLLGLLVIFGWYTHNESLIQILPTFAPMQYNTALGFTFSGISLLFFHFNKSRLGLLFGVLVGLLGSLTLLEYLLGTSLGVDELFLKHYITVNTFAPGRMAPNTALCFVLSSIALAFMMGSIRKIRLSGVIGSLVFGIGSVAFAGYFIGVEMNLGLGKYTKIAIHTATGFMALAIAITVLSWEKEIQYRKTIGVESNSWFVGYAISMAITAFMADIGVPPGMSHGFPYIFLVLMGAMIPHLRATIYLAFASTILILISLCVTKISGDVVVTLLDRLLAIFSIWVIALSILYIKKKQMDLKAVNEVLRIKNRDMEQFAYITSHDLQEPLRTVSSFVGLLQRDYEGKLDPHANKSLEYISQATGRMSNLIKGLLDFSRIGRTGEKSRIDCNEIIENIQSDMATVLKNTGATITTSPLPEIDGYRTEFRLLLQNLVSNAIKFQKSEVRPEINIGALRENGHWKFSVSDNGIGIPNEHQDRIFKIFQRLHLRKDYAGTGIGLAHCQKVVDIHGGKIWVESEINRGSTFYFTVPIEQN